MGLADQRRDDLPPRADVGLQVLEGLDACADVRIVRWADVRPDRRLSGRAGRAVEVPVATALHGHRDEASVRREVGGEAGVQAALGELGVERLVGVVEAFHQLYCLRENSITFNVSSSLSAGLGASADRPRGSCDSVRTTREAA